MSDVAGIAKVTAIAEVRYKDGNLISSTPVELTGEVTAEQMAAIEADTTEKEK